MGHWPSCFSIFYFDLFSRVFLLYVLVLKRGKNWFLLKSCFRVQFIVLFRVYFETVSLFLIIFPQCTDRASTCTVTTHTHTHTNTYTYMYIHAHMDTTLRFASEYIGWDSVQSLASTICSYRHKLLLILRDTWSAPGKAGCPLQLLFRIHSSSLVQR